MRRGPGKSTSNANPSQANGNAPSSGGGGGAGGGGGGGASSESVSNRSMSPGRPSSNTSAQSGNGPVGALGSLPTSTRRNPSLGNLSHGAPAHLSTGTGGAPTLGSPAMSSPGLFSFAAAAAAAGGGGAAGGGIGTAPSNVANSTSSTAGTGSGATSQQSVSSTHQSAANADADYKLLSLYGAEPQSNSQPKSPLPDAGKEHWSTVNNTERGKKKVRRRAVGTCNSVHRGSADQSFIPFATYPATRRSSRKGQGLWSKICRYRTFIASAWRRTPWTECSSLCGQHNGHGREQKIRIVWSRSRCRRRRVECHYRFWSWRWAWHGRDEPRDAARTLLRHTGWRARGRRLCAKTSGQRRGWQRCTQ